ncbi:MAG: hypothetical protein ACNA7U_07870, partial [Candidatus Izemoplasmataceae bacterium]
MKKLFVLTVLMLLTLTLSACANSELQSTLRKINRAQNYSVVTNLEMPGATYGSVVKKDNDFLAFSSDFEQFIMAKLDNKYYVYTPITSNAWTRTQIDEDDFINDTNFVAPINHLKASWFTEDEGVWRLKENRYDDFLDHEFFSNYQVDQIHSFVIEVSDSGIYWFLSYTLNNELISMSA